MKTEKLLESISATSISPYEVPDRHIIRPIYGDDEYLEEIKLGWVRDLKVVAEIGGTKIYWNRKLAKRVMDEVSKFKQIRPCKDRVMFLFQKAKIVPGFTSSSMIMLILKKIAYLIFGVPRVLAFFTHKHKAIFLILENLSTMFFNTQDEKISRILIHELLHYSAYDRHSKFYSSFSKILLDWYSYYFSLLLGCDRYDRNFLAITRNVIKILSATDKGTSFDKIWKNYRNEVLKYKKITDFDDDTFDSMYKLHFAYIHAYFSGRMFELLAMYERTPIAKVMFEAYKHGINLKRYPHTFVIQELVYPSEIICCMSELKLLPSMYGIINSLRP